MIQIDWLNELVFQAHQRLMTWRQYFRLRRMKRQYAHLVIAPDTRCHAELLVQMRKTRRETKTAVYYVVRTDLKPEVYAWICANAVRGVHSSTYSDGSMTLFFDSPDDALAFRMRWM